MSDRKLSPGVILIPLTHFQDLVSVAWKPGVSLGRAPQSQYYEYLIVDDMGKAKMLIPFDFKHERDISRTVINVDKNKVEMERHATEMGLEVMCIGFFWKKLVIFKTIPTEPPLCGPPPCEPPSCELPPPYETSSCGPPPYDSVNDPSKHRDSKPENCSCQQPSSDSSF